MSIEAMKQALEALESAVDQLAKPYSTQAQYAITSLRQAIAEAENQYAAKASELAHLSDRLWIDPKTGNVSIGSSQAIAEAALEAKAENARELGLNYEPDPQPKREPLMLEKFREMKALLDDDTHTHKKMFTDDQLKIIMETTMPEIDWKARHGVELNNGERNKWMLEWFIAFARAIEAAHGIKE